MIDKIVKRDGRIVDFDDTKIQVSLKLAFNSLSSGEIYSNQDDVIKDLTTKVIDIIKTNNNQTITVEDIQDIIVTVLNDSGYTAVAKNYENYRKRRNQIREQKTSLMMDITRISQDDSIDNDNKRENANINGDTAMGTMLKYGSTTAKEYFLTHEIKPEYSDAHRNGYIHIHDLDFYSLTCTCCQIDIKSLLARGFSTGHGNLRQPNSINSAAALACIAIQSNQNDQHGGQAIPNFDYGLAPYVAKSFIKNIIKVIDIIYNIDSNNKIKNKIINNLENIYDTHQTILSEDAKKDVINVITRLRGTDLNNHVGNNVPVDYIIDKALQLTDKDTYQAMEAVVHNLNTMHCLHENQEVYVLQNKQPGILKKIKDVHENDYILSLNISTKEYEYKKITSVMNNGIRDVYKYTLDNGDYVLCTTNHRVLQLDEDELYYTEIGKVSYLVTLENNSYIKHDIVSVDLFDNSNVIDIEVEDNHNFVVKGGYIVHNSRAGAQVPFSSLNFGTDTTQEGRMVSINLLKACDAGLGMGETPIFPITILKVKEGINYNPEDPNYDIFKLSCKVSAKRLFPNFEFLDAPFNAQYYKPGHPETEVATMGCLAKETKIMWCYAKDMQSDNIFNKASITTFEDAFLELSKHYVVEQQGQSYYINTANKVFVFDLNTKTFVNCKKFIKNPITKSTPWYKVTFKYIIEKNDDVTRYEYDYFYCTGDHPLPIYDIVTGKSNRTQVQDIIVDGDKYLNICSKNSIDVYGMIGLLVNIEKVKPRDTDKFSYDVETVTDRFMFITDNCNFVDSHNCRTRVMGNVYDPDNEIAYGRGNLSFTSINLPRLALESDGNLNVFMDKLDYYLELCKNQLLERFKLQCNKHIKNYPFLMGQGVWINSDKLNVDDTLETVLSNGTLTIGFIGLAETLKVLTGKHHGESEKSQELGLEIIKHMRDFTDEISKEYKLNFSIIGTPAEGLCLAGDTLVQTPMGYIPIKDIKAGSIVYSYNLKTRTIEEDRVVKSWMTSPHRKVMKITYDTILATNQTLICTPNHPIAIITDYINNTIEYIEAKDLKCKMGIVTTNNEFSAIITNIEYLSQEIPVYDITVEHNSNFFVGEGTGILVHNSGRFIKMDKKRFGIIPGVTDRDYYTNSFHVPVYYPISIAKKIDIEAPYHALTNGGHISYVELDGNPSDNLVAFERIVRYMKEKGIGYGSINHPVDRDPICGYTGIIGDVCPGCGRREGEPLSPDVYREIISKNNHRTYGNNNDCDCCH